MTRLFFWLIAASLSIGAPKLSFAQDPPLTPTNGGQSIDASALQPGDILFASTNDPTSYFIRVFTGGGPASHVAVVSDNIGGAYFVIEALGSGVQKNTLTDFLNVNSIVVAFRYPNISAGDMSTVLAYLNARIGAPYDIWGAVKAAFFKLNNNDVVVDYGQFKTQGTYCSKLLIEAYLQANVNLCTLSGGSGAPNDLITMTWFDILNYVGHLKYTP
jgi:uncharacterized protein YycO